MKCREFPKDYENDLIFSYAKTRELTRLLNALSLLFPEGERFFVRAVRQYENQYSPNLKEDCKIFYKQEARHSMEHQRLNAILKANGLDVEKLEAEAKQRLYKVGKTDEEKLLVTHSLEILTGIGGWLLPHIQNYILKDSNLSTLWKVHALEEKEHVHVAENAVYEVVKPSKYKMAKYFVISTANLIQQTSKNYKEINNWKNIFFISINKNKKYRNYW